LRGADFQLCPKHSYFSANWRLRWGLNQLTAVTALRAPPYLIPRRLYPRIAWSQSLRSWGGSEASVSVKSFFSAIEIVHVRGPLARHRFQRAFSYDVTWEDMWRNQAIIARVCFDDATWFRHWLPNVFQAHLSRSARAIVDSREVQVEHEEFLGRKVRTDRQFWTELLRCPPPAGV
jgi:hypothetical protein